MITQKTKLSIIPGTEIPVIHIDQGDTGSGRLKFEITKDGSAYSGGAPVIQGTKPNGEGFSHSCARSGNIVTADLYTDMTDVHGDVSAQIVLTEGANRTGSQKFILRVQRTAYDNTNI